jgi:hypothetical protein
VPRFPYPDRKTFPQELQDFLAQVPEHLNFDMMSYSQSTIESFIRQGEARYTGLELPPRLRELVILTTAAVTSAEYEFVQHVPISEAAQPHRGRPDVRRGTQDPEQSRDRRGAAGRRLLLVVRTCCDGPGSRNRTRARYRGHRGQQEGRDRVATSMTVSACEWRSLRAPEKG